MIWTLKYTVLVFVSHNEEPVFPFIINQLIHFDPHWEWFIIDTLDMRESWRILRSIHTEREREREWVSLGRIILSFDSDIHTKLEACSFLYCLDLIELCETRSRYCSVWAGPNIKILELLFSFRDGSNLIFYQNVQEIQCKTVKKEKVKSTKILFLSRLNFIYLNVRRFSQPETELSFNSDLKN